MEQRKQTERLTAQHKESHGEVGIFGDKAKEHDSLVCQAQIAVWQSLQNEFPQLKFQYRSFLSKEEINQKLQKIDSDLGQTLFLKNSRIIPDGGILEVADDSGDWHIILVTEAKYQGKDIENIKAGKLVGKNNDQDLMEAGNAIDRAHKNISEVANYMLDETYFPYILFIEGSNFLTENVSVTRPDGREVVLRYDSGTLNRIDHLTAANYGMPLNTNLCINKFIKMQDSLVMLQAPSIYTQGNGGMWTGEEMFDIMLDVAKTSIHYLAKDLFEQLTNSDK